MLPNAFIASRPSGLPNSELLARKRDGRPVATRSTSGSSSPFGWLRTKITGLPRRDPLGAVDGPQRVVEAHQALAQHAHDATNETSHRRN